MEDEVQIAREWLNKHESSFELCVDQSLKRLNFQLKSSDFTFYIDVIIEEGQTKLHVWSDNDDILVKLQPTIEQVTGNRLQTIEEVLRSCSTNLLRQRKKEEEAEEDEDEECEDVDEDSDYYCEEEDFLNNPSMEASSNKQDDDSDIDLEAEESLFGSTTPGTAAAVQRLRKDLKNILKVGPSYGIVARPKGDNLFLWNVELKDFPTDGSLGRDLATYAAKYNTQPVLNMEIQFPNDYPFSPPFVRIVTPRFKFLTGHVTIGGSICMELLTRTGWRATNDIESIMISVRAEIMSDPNAGLDLSRPNAAYTESEAKEAFHRMVQRQQGHNTQPYSLIQHGGEEL